MRVYLGESAALLYKGQKTKEFTRANFYPKPIVQSGDIIILDKLAAYNLAKLLPNEWQLLEKEYIQIDEPEVLQEKLKEAEDYINELQEELAQRDLKEELEANGLNAIQISPDEALQTQVIKAYEEFASKEELQEYAQEFGLELNTKVSLKKMYDTFLDFVKKDDKESEPLKGEKC